MLDDLLDLAADLVGDTAAEFMSDSTRKRRGGPEDGPKAFPPEPHGG